MDYESLSAPQALAMQQDLARRVIREDSLGLVRHVCGIDVHYGAGDGTACAAAVVLGFPELEPVDRAVVRSRVRFPYVTGLLAFREAPAALEALAALAVKPDVIFCDGQGIAHPRRCGLASHLGVLAALPSIGVAKTRLVGVHREPGVLRGAWAPLVDGGEEIGAVLRTRANVRPVYVSIGHRVSLATAIQLTLMCSPRFREPEPIRAADRMSRGR